LKTKKFGIDFHSSGGALTLSAESVKENCALFNREEYYTRTHASGWTITGKISEDYYTWVNDFMAYNPDFGWVEGNFEDKVYATSEEAFKHFWKNHQPQAWDYQDI
jgi:hypothetical protein